MLMVRWTGSKLPAETVEAGVRTCMNRTNMTNATTRPTAMNPYRRTVALAADALVLASRQAIGLVHTPRGLRVLSPVEIFSFWRTSVLSDVVDWAIRRSRMMLGVTIRNVIRNMNPM